MHSCFNLAPCTGYTLVSREIFDSLTSFSSSSPLSSFLLFFHLLSLRLFFLRLLFLILFPSTSSSLKMTAWCQTRLLFLPAPSAHGLVTVSIHFIHEPLLFATRQIRHCKNLDRATLRSALQTHPLFADAESSILGSLHQSCSAPIGPRCRVSWTSSFRRATFIRKMFRPLSGLMRNS